MKKYFALLILLLSISIGAVAAINNSFNDTFAYYMGSILQPDPESNIMVDLYLYDYSNKKMKKVKDRVGKLDCSITFLKAIFWDALSKESKVDFTYTEACKTSDGYTNADCSAYSVMTPTKGDIVYLNDAFEKVYKIKLFEKIYNKDFDKRNYLIMYKSDAIEKAFDSIYLKPDNKYNGISLQKYYDLIFKDWIRKRVMLAHEMVSNSKEFQSNSKLYLQEFSNNPNFNGRYFTMKIAKPYIQKAPYDTVFSADRFAGMLYRRQIDGSLPTVLKCLDTITKDYDPDFHKKYNFKLYKN